MLARRILRALGFLLLLAVSLALVSQGPGCSDAVAILLLVALLPPDAGDRGATLSALAFVPLPGSRAILPSSPRAPPPLWA